MVMINRPSGGMAEAGPARIHLTPFRPPVPTLRLSTSGASPAPQTLVRLPPPPLVVLQFGLPGDGDFAFSACFLPLHGLAPLHLRNSPSGTGPSGLVPFGSDSRRCGRFASPASATKISHVAQSAICPACIVKLLHYLQAACLSRDARRRSRPLSAWNILSSLSEHLLSLKVTADIYIGKLLPGSDAQGHDLPVGTGAVSPI